MTQRTEQIENEARRMYESCPTSKPSWEQLSDVTKSVWRERAEANIAREDGK